MINGIAGQRYWGPLIIFSTLTSTSRLELLNDARQQLYGLVGHRQEWAMRRIHGLNYPFNARVLDESILCRQWQSLVLKTSNVGTTAIIACFLDAQG